MITFQRRTHPVWHITALCIGVIAGVATAKIIVIPVISALFIVGILIGVLSIASKRTALVVTACLAGILIGLARGSAVQSELDRYEPLIGKKVSFTGTIREDIDTNSRGQKIIKLKKIYSGEETFAGSLWLTTHDERLLRRSDIIQVDGKVSEGFGSFSATMYDAQIISVERPTPGDVALEARDHMAHAVKSVIDEPAASLGQGYLLGQKSVLPRELSEALVVTGLTHVVVASGYNLTILVRIARRFFEKISKYLTVLVGAALIAGFITVTGFSPSMSRAGLVAALGLWAWYYGRRFHPVTLLALVGAVSVLVNPSYAWGDIGWELSFAAFFGVMIMAPLLKAYMFGDETPHTVGQIIIETISAQIMTAPIVLVVFGQFSVIALFANLLIVPFVPLAMLLVFIAGMGAILMPVISHYVAWPASFVLDMMIFIIMKCSEMSWAQVKVEFGWQWAVICYIAILGTCWYLKRVTNFRLSSSSIVE